MGSSEQTPEPSGDESKLDKLKEAGQHLVDEVLDKIVDGPLLPHNSQVAKKDKNNDG
jgi:hypothetical protein